MAPLVTGGEMIINPIKVEDRTPIVINKETKILIIGTMISYGGRFLHNSDRPIGPGNDYFYPNVTQNYLWEWLFDIFCSHSNKPVKERTKNEKEELLLKNNLGMVNLIKKAWCQEGSSSDDDIHILEYKVELLDKLKKSEVSKICFTSKDAKILFLDLIRKNGLIKDSNRKIEEKVELFDRCIKLKTLPTPTRGRLKKDGTPKFKIYKAEIKLHHSH